MQRPGFFLHPLVFGVFCMAGFVALGPAYGYAAFTPPTYTPPAPYQPPGTSAGTALCSVISQNLYIGISDTLASGEVNKLQNFLASQGYFVRSATGYFGTATAAATRAFQNSQGISATGYVGPLTRAAVQRVSCGGSASASKPQIQALAPSSGQAGTSVLLMGSGFLGDNAIYFDNYPLARVSSRGGTTLGFVVPALVSGSAVEAGRHDVFVQNANGSSNTLSFTVIVPSSSAQRPAIQSVTTPGTLYAGQTATWVVYISLPTGYTSKSYLSARWGDENLTSDNSTYANSQSVRGSTVTLTHTYAFPGNYKATFSIVDDNEQVLASVILTTSVR